VPLRYVRVEGKGVRWQRPAARTGTTTAEAAEPTGPTPHHHDVCKLEVGAGGGQGLLDGEQWFVWGSRSQPPDDRIDTPEHPFNTPDPHIRLGHGRTSASGAVGAGW
jgi:hypothetical protein